jgi:hypothetical protein
MGTKYIVIPALDTREVLHFATRFIPRFIRHWSIAKSDPNARFVDLSRPRWWLLGSPVTLRVRLDPEPSEHGTRVTVETWNYFYKRRLAAVFEFLRAYKYSQSSHRCMFCMRCPELDFETLDHLDIFDVLFTEIGYSRCRQCYRCFCGVCGSENAKCRNCKSDL